MFIRTSVYRPSSHSSGKFRVEPDSPEFAFWMWLVNDRKPMRRINEKDYATVHGDELEMLREEYRNRSTGAA